MRILLYEFFSGGGLWDDRHVSVDDAPLLLEGRAMFAALAADLIALPQLEVVAACDVRLDPPALPGVEWLPVDRAEGDLGLLRTWSRRVDGVLLIAPEWDDQLLRRAQAVVASQGTLLSPGPEFVELAASHPATLKRLDRAGVRCVRGDWWDPSCTAPPSRPGPWVIKWPDGAGAMGTRVVVDPSSFASMRRASSPNGLAENGQLWVETFVRGLPASVAALCGGPRPVCLTACAQHIRLDGRPLDDGTRPAAGRIEYAGGHLPLPAKLTRRATALAQQALEALPPTRGYVGVDLVLDTVTGHDRDVVVEINPRLTTSYLGLRQVVRPALASLVLEAATGQPVTPEILDRRVEFAGEL